MQTAYTEDMETTTTEGTTTMETTTVLTEEQAQRVVAFRRTAKSLVETGVEARQQLAERIAEGNYPLDSLWGATDWTGIGQAELAAEFAREGDDHSDEVYFDHMRYVAGRLTESIMNGYLDGTSSNDVANGFQSVKRTATRMFLRTLNSYIGD